MHSNSYPPPPATLAGVLLRQKPKRCGRQGCTHCPHLNYWYAYLPAALTRNGHKAERYLGRMWDEKRLLKQIMPVLSAPARSAVLAELKAYNDRRRQAELKARLISSRLELQRLAAQRRAEMSLLRDDQARLRGEIAKLRSTRPNPAPRPA